MPVAGQQSIGGSGERLDHQREQLEHLPVDLLQVRVRHGTGHISHSRMI